MNSPFGEQLGPLKYEAAPLRNKIITSLRRAVETGVLEPGRRLVEKDLCAQLNVSRTSLREALRQLQAEGVLTNTANRGMAVVEITREDAANIYRIRGVLEALIVEQLIAHATEPEFDELRRSAKVLQTANRSANSVRIVGATTWDVLRDGHVWVHTGRERGCQ